jgi:sugar/nucleoside kinase (ribokinase family)
LGGVYLFHNHDLGYWDEVAQFRRTFSGPLLWEVSSDSCRLEHRDAVWDRFQAVDILSVNEAEAFALLGTADLATAIGELRHAGLTVLLRRGANGSLVLNKGEVYAVGTAPTQAQDPTGGGNSYSGAFLAAYAHTGELGCAARTAAAAASVVVAAPGSPEVGATIRQSVEDAATGVSFDRC